MLSNKKAVYFICNENPKYTWVSGTVWKILMEKNFTEPTDIIFDGRQVVKHVDDRNNEYYFVPTEVPLCLNYDTYLPLLNEYFSDFDFSGMVTWHEGASAPPKVLTVHSLGDVNSGIYGPADPALMRSLMQAYERNRVRLGLEDFQVVTEATHWSGANTEHSHVEQLPQFPVPMVDIEVGSEPESWTNVTACQALADSLTQVFDTDDRRVHNMICIGGIHFEPSFAQMVFEQWDNDALGITHIIANQWLVAGEYENEDGVARTSAAVDAIKGGIEGVAFHDKMKGCYKDLVRAIGEKYGVEIYKHQKLRHPQDFEWKK